MSYFRENIERMVGYVPGEQPTDPKVVKLNTNENPYPPSERVLATLASVNAEQLRRYPDPTAVMFRETAANVLGFSPEQIICGNGSDELLNIATRAFVGPQGLMAYPVPTYSLYRTLAHIEDAGFVEIPFGPDWSLPEELYSTGAKLTLLCNPNAPSGTMIETDEVAHLAKKLDGVLIMDEAYVDFADNNCLELVDKHKNVLILRTLSKGYSLAGLRFGYGIGNRKLIAGLNKVKDSYNCDALSVLLATEAISDQEVMRENARKVRDERERLSERLQAVGFEVPESQANFLLARMPAGCALTAKQLYKQLKERDVCVRYMEQTHLADCVRITVGRPEQNETLLQMMRQVGVEI
ncbi:MAG: histidinol-phosphate transaminase [Phycisphaerae bacterium]|nr:histidinol-phosphate transaminase [Phycisphaerae bacterium]